MSNHLFDLLIGEGAPGAPAVIGPSHTLTYGELETETARWASALASLGVEPGDRIAAQVEKSTANLLLYLATIRAGAVYLPLNTGYTAHELAYFLGDAEPRLVVCDPSSRGAVESVAAGARVICLDGEGGGPLAEIAAHQSTDFPAVARAAGDLAAVCYTSGTTGRSKGAMLTHGNLVSNALALRDLWRFTASDVLIHALPIYHVHGLFVATNVLLMAGGAMILQPKFDPEAVISSMRGATCLMGVPTFYTRLLASPHLTRQATEGMRLFISGSAPLLADTHGMFELRTGHVILERYGMTETGMNTSNPYDGERRAGAVGFPVPGVEIRVVGGAGETLEHDEIGAVEVKGSNVFAGYWRRPELTASEFRPGGWFVTGDLGVVDSEGYLSIVGRGKDMIITGGLNVYPKEVELLLDAAPGVVESAVIGLPHADLGEAVTAVVVTDGEVEEAALLAATTETLARFKQPKRVIIVDALPRNAMGKVQKAVLRARHAGLYGPDLNAGRKAST